MFLIWVSCRTLAGQASAAKRRAAALQVWHCASDFPPTPACGGRLTWWCNHWRWHLDFNHKLIASLKQLKIYSQGKKCNGCQVRRLCWCVPAMPLPLKKKKGKKGLFLNQHKKFQHKYKPFLMRRHAHVVKWSIWDSSVFYIANAVRRIKERKFLVAWQK